ncbi:MAG: UDP-N-acetylmuramoyl-tripeptide--D-alanyl-D-alanine ligase, partial [Campylobacterota bacterium]|nr:UDP-N-acetylmuramoyl-tripeptide--D-alanyl-D-alanine ligase [Campylobacterota bacterium]
MNYELLFAFVTNLLFVTALGWYLITNLQWYDYKIERVVLRHHKTWWHLFYFIIPFIAYYATGRFFWIFFYFAILPSLFIWHRKLDKKLVLTWRVRRFLILLIALTLFQNLLCTLKGACELYGVFMPLAVAYIGSTMIEKYLFMIYKKEASRKLESMKQLKIIAVTGSYGKTSMKNFMTQILSKKYNVYATPRSVNTIGGIIRDVNETLSEDTEVYICEAGAREQGDIYQIARLLHPHVTVVGKIGPQHIEYFKTMEKIIRTKLEIMSSDRLERSFIHKSVTDETHEKVTHFGEGITNLSATLDGLEFDLEVAGESLHLHTALLGGFQAININAAVLVAKEMGMSNEEIVDAVANLHSVEHRLQRIDAGGKIILDDGYNGNIDGMLEGIRLCSLHGGRKVIVTPGLVESTAELNLQLINAINDVFDIAIITGKLNSELYDNHLKVSQKIILHDKGALETILGQHTKAGDIILFANDAPNF